MHSHWGITLDLSYPTASGTDSVNRGLTVGFPGGSGILSMQGMGRTLLSSADLFLVGYSYEGSKMESGKHLSFIWFLDKSISLGL